MGRVALRAGFAFVLGLGTAVCPILAEDTKPTQEKETKEKEAPAKVAPAKAPDWSGYVFVSDVVGEVIKADDKNITLRITWFAPQTKGANRPKLSQNNRNFRNPFQPNHNRPNQPQLKEQHHDYVLEYLSQSLVRTKTLPPKLDDKGKKVSHTQAEIDELREPPGARGYAANKSDLVLGTIVEVYLIRDKSVSAAKATEEDLRVKYAMILGKDPNPPKDPGTTPKKDEKKKN